MQETIIQKIKRLNADIFRDIDPNAVPSLTQTHSFCRERLCGGVDFIFG